MPAIEVVCWGTVGPMRQGGIAGTLLAVWPAPIDHDDCFAQAGVTRFADSDDAWDADFDALVAGLLAALALYGEPAVTGIEPVWRRSLSDRLLGRHGPELDLVRRVVLASRDDQLGPCRVAYGEHAMLVAKDGHPILWLWLADGVDADRVLVDGARGRPLVAQQLAWGELRPPA